MSFFIFYFLFFLNNLKKDINKLKEIKTYLGHEDYITCLAELTPLIASSSVDKLIHLWDTNSGESVKVLSGHTSIINSIV